MNEALESTQHRRSTFRRWFGTVLPSLAVIGTTTFAIDASACGCLSPPIPSSVDDSDYAVNQQAESILFEVEPGYVTAHVLIRYAGDPEKFAWIVPVPTEPELSLSSASTFGIMEQATAPRFSVSTQDVCPTPEFICKSHPAPSCPDRHFGNSDDDSLLFGSPTSSAAGGSANAGGNSAQPPPVTVVARQQVGSYDTVTLGAGDAQAAVDWLQEEGFIVNDTMAPFMQPYVEMGMLLVASKLIPGADADEIRPLRMRFEADMPMVPLQLTAVASEPHLTVTAYIFSNEPFQPHGLPLVTLRPEELGRGAAGRINYPMLLARSIDEAGGDGFVREYVGPVPSGPQNGNGSYCCGNPNPSLGWAGAENEVIMPDYCGLGGDGLCQCPAASFDQEDCEETAPDLLEGVDLARELASQYSTLTRLTTRLSPEEMTFDPAFAPDPKASPFRLSLQGAERSLARCEQDVIDRDSYDEVSKITECAAVYCGAGECAATEASAGCVCDEGYVGRSFVDLDGKASVTCVPAVNPVDFAAGGIELPDVCASTSCGEGGKCKDLGGFPSCECDDGFAAITDPEGDVSCLPILQGTGGPGASNYTDGFSGLEVCSPSPSKCGKFGWLIDNPNNIRPGVACDSSIPDMSEFEVPPEPTCDEYYGDIGKGSGGAKGSNRDGGNSSASDDDPLGSGRIGGCSCSSVGRGTRHGGDVPRGLAALLLGFLAVVRLRRGRA